MGLIQRILGNTGKDKPGASSPSAPAPLSSAFQESQIAADEDDEEVARANRRREIIKVMLRETMRQHGIPAEWIECRILPTVGRNKRPAMHVSFVVHQAHDKLLGYVFAFQDSFRRELLRFEPQAKDWGVTVGWQFEGEPAGVQKTAMPDPKTWEAHGAPPQPVPPSIAGTSLAAAAAEAPMASLDLLDSQDTEPSEEDDVQRDLAALFAIRDAVLAKDLSAAEEVEAQQAAAVAAAEAPPRRARRGEDESLSDFEPTRPFDRPPEEGGAGKPR